MGFGKNNVLHANHFRKDWQRRVKTWFDQPGKKSRRRAARATKATALGARPLKSLRPAVRCPTVRYNTKVREGRGFTHRELKAAGVGKKEARGLGICVDHRRRGGDEKAEQVNVERLKNYRERLIVFPRKAGKTKKGDTEGAADIDLKTVDTIKVSIPVTQPYEAEKPRAITSDEKEFEAYRTLRIARAAKRNAGQIKKRAEKKAAEEAAAKK